MAGAMGYLTDHRARLRNEPKTLLSSAESIVCVAKLYNGPEPYSDRFTDLERGWISRYAWGDDYHTILRDGLERLARRLVQADEGVEYRICVDTAPLLERSYARQAGLGWIGRNTCLIRERMGSWFFLGEMLINRALEADRPAPDRCGTCRRCIDACPTQAIVPSGLTDGPEWRLDARLCLSYDTIELHGSIPPEHREALRNFVFGCDICQDVCPWNGRAPVTADARFSPRYFAPPLDKLASIEEREFREMFRGSPVRRTRYRGFLRNVIVAMGNSGRDRFRTILERLSQNDDTLVREHAEWALGRLKGHKVS